LETEVFLWPEVSDKRPEQADDEEYGSDDDMETVEAGCHKEGRAIDVAAIVAIEGESGMVIFIGLDRGEHQTERDGQRETPFEPLAVVVQQRVMRPGDGCARGQEDERIDERQVPGIEDIDTLRGPYAGGHLDTGRLNGIARKQARIEVGPEP